MRRLSSQVTFILLAASLAALAAHWLIDFAGDYLLERDAYDTVAHGSRSVALVGALALLAGATCRLLLAAVREARGEDASLGAALAEVLLPARTFSVLVTAAAFALVAGMEALDILQSGAPIDDPGDLLPSLFGGSLWLGCGATLLCALAASFGLRAMIRFAASVRHVIIAAVAALLRLPRDVRIRRHFGRMRDVRARLQGGVLARMAGRRAPPLVRALDS